MVKMKYTFFPSQKKLINSLPPLTEVNDSQRHPPRDTPLHVLSGGSSMHDMLNTRHLPFSRRIPGSKGVSSMAAPNDAETVMRISLAH